MPYDDDPYWGGYVSPHKAQQSPVAQRSLPDATEVLAKSQRCHRAQQPSPLLVEWLKAKGLTVK